MKNRRNDTLKIEDITDEDSDNEDYNNKLGNYETEQLITAITKITDLLRKCWGVAGAGIISANLARNKDGDTVVFNPTVPGKLVYALFGFAGIDDFSNLLVSLEKDVMILINDLAKVIHNQVLRWGLGDSGQCNKNLGSAFLLVYRIGEFKDVHEKTAKAARVIFDKNITLGRRKNARRNRRSGPFNSKIDTIQLASLPGINAFADRALLGMLKSFAGIHGDKSIRKWQEDFRLGAGVGAFSIEMIFGMDAGWAVEGAVGSKYKVDATYLSPHVNMASRMMSACKQYGVAVIVSEKFEELLSQTVRKKLRHLDTVTVKGSSIEQRIFTYDARHKGVNFFLWRRADEDEEINASGYDEQIWENDQDLSRIRDHISPLFLDTFAEGLNFYLDGKWPQAIEKLREADTIMIQTIVEDGLYEFYLRSYDLSSYGDQLLDPLTTNEEILRLRHEVGDRTCHNLISYMEKEGGGAPDDWRGFRPLTAKIGRAHV